MTEHIIEVTGEGELRHRLGRICIIVDTLNDDNRKNINEVRIMHDVCKEDLDWIHSASDVIMDEVFQAASTSYDRVI